MSDFQQTALDDGVSVGELQKIWGMTKLRIYLTAVPVARSCPFTSCSAETEIGAANTLLVATEPISAVQPEPVVEPQPEPIGATARATPSLVVPVECLDTSRIDSERFALILLSHLCILLTHFIANRRLTRFVFLWICITICESI